MAAPTATIREGSAWRLDGRSIPDPARRAERDPTPPALTGLGELVVATISGYHGRWLIDFGFSIVDDYAQCTIDSNCVDTRHAMCSVYLQEDQIFTVRIWTPGTQDGRRRARNAEF